MNKHTPGPWKIIRHNERRPKSVTASSGSVCSFNARLWDRDPIQAQANASRIISCVNSCDGIENPALALEMARVALKAAQSYLRNTDAVKIRAIDDALAALGVK